MNGQLQTTVAPVNPITVGLGASPRGSLYQSSQAETYNETRGVRLPTCACNSSAILGEWGQQESCGVARRKHLLSMQTRVSCADSCAPDMCRRVIAALMLLCCQ